MSFESRSTYTVEATIPGNSTQSVLIGNHRDSWVYGANDPASGTIALIETARAFGQLLKDGYRSVHFADGSPIEPFHSSRGMRRNMALLVRQPTANNSVITPRMSWLTLISTWLSRALRSAPLPVHLSSASSSLLLRWFHTLTLGHSAHRSIAVFHLAGIFCWLAGLRFRLHRILSPPRHSLHRFCLWWAGWRHLSLHL